MKLVVSILFSLCMTGLLYGQQIHFPDSNATWSVYTEKYFIQGDSLYNSKIYKKFYLSNDSLLADATFFALFREDTASGKAYAIPGGSDNEQLLYDFSLNIYDMTTVYPISFPYSSGPVSISVDQIDSVFIEGKYRKRFLIKGVDQDSNLPEYWIEGIGSTFGIFNSGLTGKTLADIYYPTLLCFEQEGAILFQNPDFNNCYEPYPIGISENELSCFIQVFPNPAFYGVMIKSDELIVSFKVFSSTGLCLNSQFINTREFYLNMSGYQNGMYWINLETRLGKVSKKVIKYGL